MFARVLVRVGIRRAPVLSKKIIIVQVRAADVVKYLRQNLQPLIFRILRGKALTDSGHGLAGQPV